MMTTFSENEDRQQIGARYRLPLPLPRQAKRDRNVPIQKNDSLLVGNGWKKR